MDLLKVLNLDVEIENKKILKNISFNLAQGEIVLISGNSGCGKSTLINAITGIIPEVKEGIVKGHVFLEGKCISNNTIFERANDMITLIQDVESQIINIMVDDELSFILENSGESAKNIEKEIKKIEPFVNIDSAHSLVSNLSGGQKQRVSLASFLVKKPKILILDEPLANLDEESIFQLLKHIKELKIKGVSILIIEHRLEYIIDIVDKLIWMENGEIISEVCGEKIKANFIKSGYEAVSMKVLENNNEKLINQNNKVLVKKEKKQSVLSIKNLTVSFDKKVILKNISLDINENLIIVGQNGAGKTTLIKTLASITKYKNITYDDFILGGLKVKNKNTYRKINNHIGYVFQNPSHQLFMQSVEEEIAINAKNEKIKMEIIRLFNLKDKLKAHPLSLSQGEKRLLAVASTLAKLPKIIFLDEPTIGLDYKTLTKLLNILKYISEFYKVQLVIVTHDRKVIKDLNYKILRL